MTEPSTSASGARRNIPERARVRRTATNAIEDRGYLYELLDQHIVGHLGFAVEEQPYVLPMIYARFGDCLYLHGSPVSRLVRSIREQREVSFAVTHVDGLVLARAAFDLSLNYRSVVVFGRCHTVQPANDKYDGLMALVNAVTPGLSEHVRAPNRKELDATELLQLDIDELSGKARHGPPSIQRRDRDAPIWSGVVPILTQWGSPQPAPQQSAALQTPDCVRALLDRDASLGQSRWN